MIVMAIETAGRKTFSGTGRKSLLPKPRQPNGRHRAESVGEIKGVVLNQPHRKGDIAWDRATAIGRLILDGTVKHNSHTADILIRAANMYAQAFAGYRWALDSRRPLTTGGTPRIYGTAEDEAEAVNAALRKWADVDRAVRECGTMIEKAMQFAILDAPGEDWTAPFWVVHSLPRGLKAVVDFFGLDS